MLKHARILLVEDDEDDYILTSDSLAQLDSYQFDIEWVTNSVEALDRLLTDSFDICLLDYQLGAQSGLEVLRRVEQSNCHTPIIMLTGQTDDTLDKSALDAGAVDYLNKEEISTARFARAVRYALARNEASLERLERLKAETQNRSKDRFLAHLSHELRTPLTSILGYTELLLSSEKASQAVSELNIILSNGKHLLTLLNDVLDLSKIAADKLELNPGHIELDSFIADVFYLLQINAQDKGLSLKIESRSALPLSIIADSTRLRQILINLSYNAIKFTEHGDVTIRLWTQGSGTSEELWFEVQDTGIGIPAARLSSIFEPFAQIEDIVIRKERGAGLGLAICTELVKRMGGKLRVQSEQGRGSTFQFSIDPGDISEVSRQWLSFTKSTNLTHTESFPALQGKVLVVDDADDIRLLIETLCGNFGLEVETAENGEQAIEKCRQAMDKQQAYDVVLMDIHMPVMDGRQAMSHLRELGISSAVVAVTAAALKGVKQSLLNVGFADVLHKPLNKEALYQTLCHFLPSSSQAGPHAVNKPEPRITATNEAVLLVEDDSDAAQVTCLLLESLGKTVTVASNGSECIACLKDLAGPLTVLLDLHLPDMDGLTLAKLIHQHHSTARIIVVSGSELPAGQLQALGLDQALLKPLNMAKLQALFAA